MKDRYNDMKDKTIKKIEKTRCFMTFLRLIDAFSTLEERISEDHREEILFLFFPPSFMGNGASFRYEFYFDKDKPDALVKAFQKMKQGRISKKEYEEAVADILQIDTYVKNVKGFDIYLNEEDGYYCVSGLIRYPIFFSNAYEALWESIKKRMLLKRSPEFKVGIEPATRFNMMTPKVVLLSGVGSLWEPSDLR